jgi:hypothetical protein
VVKRFRQLPENLYSICNFLFFVLLSVYAGCNGLASIYTWETVVQGVCLQKDGFLEELFNGGLEKMASEMA